MTDYKEITTLSIYKGSEFAGFLQRTNQGCVLQFSTDFINNPRVPYFSYCIPKNIAEVVVSGDNLPPFFAGLLPEGRRLSALINRIKTSQDDLFSLFAAVGSDCVGDVFVGDLANKLFSAPPKLSTVNFYSYFEELVAPNASTIDPNALAGVQEKISASMISFPLHIAKDNKAYILKLNPADKDNLIHNELQCLQIAKKCGFVVAQAKIVVDKDNNDGLLVERFDRHNQTKIHQEDACQFLNHYPADKYRITINQIADALMQITTAPQLEILNLLRQYAFSYLMCNGDLHAKNISLQTLEDGTITLTPIYDVICTALYSDYKMALKIDGRDDNIKRKTFVDFAARYKISAKAINSMLDKLVEQFIKHHSIFFSLELVEKKKNLLHRLFKKRINELHA